jgi:hypothetical protein
LSFAKPIIFGTAIDGDRGVYHRARIRATCWFTHLTGGTAPNPVEMLPSGQIMPTKPSAPAILSLSSAYLGQLFWTDAQGVLE